MGYVSRGDTLETYPRRTDMLFGGSKKKDVYFLDLDLEAGGELQGPRPRLRERHKRVGEGRGGGTISKI